MWWQWLIMLAWGFVLRVVIESVVARRRRRQIDRPKPKIAVNYWKIARLELELLGETKPNVDSPVKAWCKTTAEIHGIDKTGHTADRTCNLNAQLGPTCDKWTHQRKRNIRYEASPLHASSSLVAAMLGTYSNQDPYADREY